MDLAKRAPLESFVYTVVDPVTGEEVPDMRVTLLSTFSAEWKKAQQQLSRKYKLKGKKHQASPDELLQSRVHMVGSVIADWEGFEENGEPLPCNDENIEHVLNTYNWLLNQLDIALSDDANFLSKG